MSHFPPTSRFPEVPQGYPTQHTYQGTQPQTPHYSHDTAAYNPGPPPPGYPNPGGGAYPGTGYPAYPAAGNHGYPQYSAGTLPPNVMHYQPQSASAGQNHLCETLGTLGGTYLSSLGGEASTDTAVGIDASAESSAISGAS